MESGGNTKNKKKREVWRNDVRKLPGSLCLWGGVQSALGSG